MFQILKDIRQGLLQLGRGETVIPGIEVESEPPHIFIFCLRLRLTRIQPSSIELPLKVWFSILDILPDRKNVVFSIIRS